MKLDLHTHTVYSDGTLDPKELVDGAHAAGITHLSISDHDSTGSLVDARQQAAAYGMTIVPGVEINTREAGAVHILGYLMEEADAGFQATLERHRGLRAARAQIILEKLNRMGIKIAISDFNHRQQSSAIGRPHIADKLKEKGIVFSRQEAFDKFLAHGRPAYVPYEGPAPKDAIDVILAAKGVPVLAHPGFYVSSQTVESLARIGLAGIEVYYPSHKQEQIRAFLELAKRLDLTATGGSDYHGPGSGHERLGEVEVPEGVLDGLRERKRKIFG